MTTSVSHLVAVAVIVVDGRYSSTSSGNNNGKVQYTLEYTLH